VEERVRVLRVIARLNVGGPALHVSYLAKGLTERGYDTMLVAGRVGDSEGSMEYASRELGVEPHYLAPLKRDISAWSDSAAMWSIRGLIREYRPHIVHTHTAKAGAVGRMAALTARLPEPPIVVHTFHGHVLRGYFDPKRTAAFRVIERSLARKTDRLIAVSPEVRDDLVDEGIAPPEKFEVIRLGLDLERRATPDPAQSAELRARLGAGDSSLLIAWLGRMTQIKRVDDLLTAFADLRARGIDAHLALAGDGPLRLGLEGLARELGVADRAHFIGLQREVAPLYGAADVVALTSGNAATPVTLIAALAAGTAIVSTDVGGVRDVVRDGETGLLVEAGDTAGIASAFERLAADPGLRRGLAEAGRSDVRQRYSVERLVGDVDGLYRRLLDERVVARRATSRVGPLTPTLPKLAVAPAPRRLRIVLLSQYFAPEVGATQSRMQSFAEYLAARGHQVTVICEFPNHPHGVIPESYRGHLYEDDRSNPYRVLRVWVKANPEKTQTTRMAFYLSYMALATAMAPVAGRADVVVATSPPLFTGLAGLALARANRAPFVLDVRDLWPAAAVSLNQIPSKNAIQLGRKLEQLLYHQASAVTAVTEPFVEHIDRIRRREPRTRLVPNGTLDMFFEVERDLSARRELGIADSSFVLMFAGTLGIAQALPSVLDAAALAPEIEFVFVGDGPARDGLVEMKNANGLENVHFHRQVALERVGSFLAAADALLVTLSAHPTFADFIPSKLIDYMATGIPVLVSARGEARGLVEQTSSGLGVDPEDPQALVEAARYLRDHRETAADMGRHGRRFASTRLRSEQGSQLESVLLALAVP